MKQPLLVVGAIVEKEDKILLIKRKKEPHKGEWCFVGGTGAFAVTNDPKEAVKKEVEYDIGCAFAPVFFTYYFAQEKTPTIALFFHGLVEGVPESNTDSVIECKWFDIQDALELKLGFEGNEILRKYVKYAKL